MAIVTLVAPYARYSGSVGKPSTINATGGQVLMPDRDGRTIARTYVDPQQPGTDPQVLAQARLSTISEAMQSLSQPQVEAWQAAAESINKTGRLGLTYKLNWSMLFQQVNNYRLQDNQPVINTVPSLTSVPGIASIDDIRSDDGSPNQVIIVYCTTTGSTNQGFLAVRVTRDLESPVRQARANEYRYPAQTDDCLIARTTGTNLELTITTTTLNVLQGTHIGVEIRVLNAGYVPVARTENRNIEVLPPV